MTVVLISLKGGFPLVILILSMEFLLYIALKVYRGDYMYWLPVYGVWGGVSHFLARLVIKLATDWTAVVQFRHPQEVGGVYFAFNMFVVMTMGISSAFLYETEKGSWAKEV